VSERRLAAAARAILAASPSHNVKYLARMDLCRYGPHAREVAAAVMSARSDVTVRLMPYMKPWSRKALIVSQTAVAVTGLLALLEWMGVGNLPVRSPVTILAFVVSLVAMQLVGMMSASGAFEVTSSSGGRIWSALESGRVPRPRDVLERLPPPPATAADGDGSSAAGSGGQM